MFTGLPGLHSIYYENPLKLKFTGLLGLHMIDDNSLLPGIHEPLKNPWFTGLLGLHMHIWVYLIH